MKPAMTDVERITSLLVERLHWIESSMISLCNEGFGEIGSARDIDHDGNLATEDATDPVGETVADKPKSHQRSSARQVLLLLGQMIDTSAQAAGLISDQLGDMRPAPITSPPRVVQVSEYEAAVAAQTKRALVREHGTRTAGQLLALAALTPKQRAAVIEWNNAISGSN